MKKILDEILNSRKFWISLIILAIVNQFFQNYSKGLWVALWESWMVFVVAAYGWWARDGK